jgi:hypothetical protein
VPGTHACSTRVYREKAQKSMCGCAPRLVPGLCGSATHLQSAAFPMDCTPIVAPAQKPAPSGKGARGLLCRVRAAKGLEAVEEASPTTPGVIEGARRVSFARQPSYGSLCSRRSESRSIRQARVTR